MLLALPEALKGSQFSLLPLLLAHGNVASKGFEFGGGKPSGNDI